MMAKTNEPIKQDSSIHTAVLIFSLIVWACLGIGGAGMNSFVGFGGSIAMIIISYFAYLITACCCSDIKGYLTNIQAFDDYKKIYDIMVSGKGYF